MSIKEIKIVCDVKLHIAVESLNEFQGGLKVLTDRNYQKLKKQIIDEGFSAPIIVWKNDGKWWILDGHQRKNTLIKMKSEGYKIPDLPCVEVKAKTKREAKKKLLGYVSQFGKVDAQGLYEYIEEAELDVDELEDYEIRDVNMDEFKAEFYEDPTGAEGQKELDEEEFQDFDHTCPKCGFQYDDKK